MGHIFAVVEGNGKEEREKKEKWTIPNPLLFFPRRAAQQGWPDLEGQMRGTTGQGVCLQGPPQRCSDGSHDSGTRGGVRFCVCGVPCRDRRRTQGGCLCGQAGVEDLRVSCSLPTALGSVPTARSSLPTALGSLPTAPGSLPTAQRSLPRTQDIGASKRPLSAKQRWSATSGEDL